MKFPLAKPHLDEGSIPFHWAIRTTVMVLLKPCIRLFNPNVSLTVAIITTSSEAQGSVRVAISSSGSQAVNKRDGQPEELQHDV